MTTTPNVQGHPASVDAYIRHGWKLTPIPPGTKGPTQKGWNRVENTLQSAAHLPHDHGIGLCHAYSGTMALDVDNWDRAAADLAQHGIDLQALYDAPDAVTIESGRPGHGKLLYAMPFGLTLPTRKINYQEEGSNRAAFELRCATSNGLTVQDVLPPTTHPETRQPYRWGGRGHWSRLPLIPPSLLQFWQGLLEQDSQRAVPNGEIDASWDEIKAALYMIDPDLNRDEWVAIGMALQQAGQQTEQEEQAYYLWDEWSATGEKYQGQRDTIICWRSFKPDGGKTIGTLFHIAKQYGWHRPIPTADEIFENVMTEDTRPARLTIGFRPPPPDLDFDLWPDILRRRALELGESVGGDPLVPLLAGVATIAGALDSRVRLELMPGFQVPPVLWLMTIGDPADKKSPGSKPMMQALKHLEAEDRPHYNDEKLKWDAQEALHQAARKSYLEYYASGEGMLENDAGPTVPDLPAPPVPLKLLVSDITSQKLVRNAADRPRGLLCWLDEMNSWVRKMGDTRAVDDRSAWVQAYESDSYDFDRVGAGNIYVENFAVSIYGNMQPAVLRQHIGGMAADGLIQRFLPVILRAEYSKRNNPIPEALSLAGGWEALVRQTYTLPKRTYTLSPAAYEAFREFQLWYEETKMDERRLQAEGSYMTAFGKLEGQTGRLALVLHVIESPYEQEVSGDLMTRVIEIMQNYFVPALRYLYNEVTGLSEDSLDAWMTNHILAQAGQTEQVTLRELKHSARRRLASTPHYQKDGLIMESMAMLEACGWVKMVDSDLRRSAAIWVINPQLAETYQDERVAVLKVKQKRLDENMQKTRGRARGRKLVPGYDPGTMDEG